ncbi:sugar ABC transporter permease [Clostridium sp. CF012]|uniref:ABC transporter permease n=1 Tax=Clostridium sp. CF012 TaxID=2843319 RepID=UPI001C0AC4DF|nr:ABC transporter permease subunit [Clostridium sp. CF012]MBU3142904.1 ABC transporter permease subunit [Clostridium sp. CF012]
MKKNNFSNELKNNWQLYVLILPLTIWLLLYFIKPLWGIAIAFENYSPFKGILHSDFVGLDNFKDLMSGPSSIYFWRAFKNTLIISLYGIVFAFPIPIILALLFNEVKNSNYRKFVQTVTYLPYFISEVVVASLVISFLALNTGIVNVLIGNFFHIFGIEYSQIQFMLIPKYFRLIYISSGVWKSCGFDSIIYFAALCGVSPTLYEAAKIDGANKLKQIIHVSLPGITPTIVIMLIIRIGHILSIGYEKVLLLYNPMIYSTADILSTYTYRLGMENVNYGLSTAASLINSIIGFCLVIAANKISKKLTQTSLW